MEKKSSAWFGVAMGAAVLTGCAAPREAPPPPTAQRAAAAESETTAPPPVAEVIETFVGHPLANYRHAERMYRLYVGGELAANYDLNEQVLTLTPEPAEDVTCRFDQNGNLIAGENAAASEQLQSTCQSLVSALWRNLN